ncbi:hypothetical protein [Flavobacterium tructae]|uniref:Uncharacterized protein n=1 Tax=Flavobacterium tructae TaxID=1114873 RepID=A0A1S1J3A0_9FLAO|nr:hypothetical protein [Flavobacterium tructae]OHT43646.1 hypothetical protein BHE19_17870 [Flavobacterium tructae]OXB15538.1 hypothetical protein B0A71_20585 [Flavobacterium tructae]
MNKTRETLSKGYQMEELLRNYFLKSGYYVLRGVPFVYEGFDVTDIDLWLYSRTSSVSREVTIVDSKNKKTPQAIERIFWVQGLRIATKATSAIVATTERRPEVKDFGRELGIVVLDGQFLQKLFTSESGKSDRISDEDFEGKINEYALNKLDGNWKGRVKHSKSLLATSLSFDSCNEWLMHAKFFAEQSITKENQRETALRCLYLICSFIAIGLDYCMKEISFQEPSERSKLIKEGFTYGSKGNIGIKKILNVAMGLVEEHTKDGSVIARQVKSNVEKQLATLNTSTLGEYFAKNEVARTLFIVAREFEQIAMAKEFKGHTDASVELRSMLFCLVDFWGFDRSNFSAKQ